MYPISVKNLYIGKIGIDLRMQGQIEGIRIKGYASLDPTTLVGEVFTPISFTSCWSPDFYIKNGYWDAKDKSFLINPVGTESHTLWITGVPLEGDVKNFLLPNNLYYNTYKDEHRIYLFQITL